MPSDLAGTARHDVPAHRAWWQRFSGPVLCVALAAVCEVLVFRYLFQYGVSNVYRYDGLAQHFASLVWFRDSAFAFFRDPLHGLQTWNWHLGLGADTFATLSYYFADPFAVLALVFPRAWIEYVYEGAYFLRVALGCLAAYVYMRKMNASRYGSVVGAIIFTFTTYTLFLALRHPFFANALIFFPLILVGIERALRDRKWGLLVAVAAIASAGNFYSFYQMSLIALVYGIARLVELRKSGDVSGRPVPEGLRVAGYYALGMGVVAGVLVPVVTAVLASSRVMVPRPLQILTSLHSLASYIVSLSTAVPGGDSVYLGFSMLGIMLVPVVFMRPGNRALKWMLAMFPVFLLSPLFGRLFNGFEFPSYRFIFMWGLFLGLAAALLLSDGRPFSRKELAAMGATLLSYAAIATAAALWGHRGFAQVVAMSGVGALMWTVAAGWAYVQARADGRTAGGSIGGIASGGSRSAAIAQGLVLVLVIVGVTAMGVGSYSKRFSTALDTYIRSGTVLDRYRESPGAVAATLGGDGPGRVDLQTGVMGSDLADLSTSNEGLVQGYWGTSYYFSLMDGDLFRYFTGLSIRPIGMGFDFNGFDDRAVMDTLLSVRDYIAPAKGAHFVPYGFEATSTAGGSTVYENAHFLPLGYVYHRTIPQSAYDAMLPLEKQQALLQGVVVADGAAPGVPSAGIVSEVVDVPYSVTATGGTALDTGAKVIHVRKKNSGIDLAFSAPANSEVYVDLTGITFKQDDSALVINTRGPIGPNKAHRMLAQGHTYDWGNRESLVNLGYFASGATGVRMRFSLATAIHYSELKVYAVPMKDYASRVATLAAEGMRDIRVGPDTLSGTVTSHGAGVLFLSMPNSPGWTATVDGVPTETLLANVGFTGIPLTDGTHVIEMRYFTPGLRTGLIVTVLSLLAVAALVAAGPGGGRLKSWAGSLRRDRAGA